MLFVCPWAGRAAWSILQPPGVIVMITAATMRDRLERVLISAQSVLSRAGWGLHRCMGVNTVAPVGHMEKIYGLFISLLHRLPLCFLVLCQLPSACVAVCHIWVEDWYLTHTHSLPAPLIMSLFVLGMIWAMSWRSCIIQKILHSSLQEKSNKRPAIICYSGKIKG